MRDKVVFGENESAILRGLTEPGSPRLITTKDATDYVSGDVSRNSLAHTMSFLSRKGVLERVGKGLYLNRSNTLLPRITELIPRIFEEVQFYLGLNAMANYWGLTPQIPNVYHVIYVPKNEAISRKIERWCLLLRKQDRLGGEIRPIKSKQIETSDNGITQKVIDETQLPVSTLEATLIDGLTYSDEAGGGDEALRWLKTAVRANLINSDEFDRVLHTRSQEIRSINARVGFLLSYLLKNNLVAGGNGSEIHRVIDYAQKELDRGPTYNWGRKSTNSTYFNEWRLHVSKDYIDQLNSVATFE